MNSISLNILEKVSVCLYLLSRSEILPYLEVPQNQNFYYLTINRKTLLTLILDLMIETQ